MEAVTVPDCAQALEEKNKENRVMKSVFMFFVLKVERKFWLKIKLLEAASCKPPQRDELGDGIVEKKAVYPFVDGYLARCANL